MLDGKALSASEVSKIADLESREVLLSKAARRLKALPTRAAGLFQAPLSQMARLAKALEEKKPAVAAAPAEAAPAEAPAAEAVEADTATEADARPRPRPRPLPRTRAPKLPPSRRSNTTNPIGRSLPADPHQAGYPASRKGRQPWRSSAPTSCSTRSRR